MSLASGLEAEGYSVAHGAAKAEGLERSVELAESACGVVLWSKAGVRHDGLAISAAQAFNAGKLTPIFLQDVEPPYPYDLIPGLDATGWKGDREEPAWRDIVSTIRDALGGKVPAPRAAPAPVSAPAPAPPPAPPVQHEPAPAPPAAGQSAWFATHRAEAAAPAAPQAPAQPPPPPPQHRQVAPDPIEPRPLPATHETYVDDARPKFALAPVLVGAFLLAAAALWAGPRIYANLKGDEAPAVAAEASPEFVSVPAAEELPSEPASLEPPGVENAEGGVAVAPEQPAAAQPDPESTLQALEQCLGRLAKQCGPLEPSLGNGFVTDGRLSAGEMRLLTSPLFPDRSLVTAQNLNACLGATTTAALGRACPSIAAKVNPPVVSVRPQIPQPIKAPAKPAPVAAKPAPAEKVAAPEPKVEPKPEAKPEPKPAAKPAPEPEAPKPKVAAPEL